MISHPFPGANLVLDEVNAGRGDCTTDQRSEDRNQGHNPNPTCLYRRSAGWHELRGDPKSRAGFMGISSRTAEAKAEYPNQHAPTDKEQSREADRSGKTAEAPNAKPTQISVVVAMDFGHEVLREIADCGASAENAQLRSLIFSYLPVRQIDQPGQGSADKTRRRTELPRRAGPSTTCRLEGPLPA